MMRGGWLVCSRIWRPALTGERLLRFPLDRPDVAELAEDKQDAGERAIFRFRAELAAPGELEKGSPIPVIITIYQDRSFTFEMRTPPVSYFIKKAAKLESGSKAPGRDKVGSITKAQVKEIAEKKAKDLNSATIEAAMRMVEGSARSMGIEVRD